VEGLLRKELTSAPRLESNQKKNEKITLVWTRSSGDLDVTMPDTTTPSGFRGITNAWVSSVGAVFFLMFWLGMANDFNNI
jgi:hypothetical protein